MDKEKYNYVNSFINNVSFPQTIEQLLDVINIKGCYDIETLRNEVSVVLQKNVLFSGTIK